MNKICKKCGHGMLLHGHEHGVGYCMEYGNNSAWCNCTEKGLSYDEELERIK